METRTVSYFGQNVEISVTDQTALVIDAVNETGRGQFGYIQNHVSGVPGKDKCVRPSVSNIWFLTNPRYDRYLARLREAVAALDIAKVSALTPIKRWDELREKAAKGKKDLTALFATAKEEILASIEKTASGDRSDGYREGHDRCYVRLGNVTIHLVTAPGEDGIMVPIRDENGRMIADGCMLPFYTIKRVYADKGEWEETDSRALTIAKECIRKATGLYDFKTFNLAKANFTAITFNSQTIFGFVRDAENAELDVSLMDYIRDIGGLTADPLSVLRAEAQTVATVKA